MSRSVAPLGYSARRALVEQMAPRYHQASLAQKMLLLDTLVTLTGYARKYAIHLLNHVPEGTRTILRSRLPRYGPEVQQALFLAWKTANHICAKRLVPFLPTLVAALERHGHLQLTEESRNHLLSMSVTTAERLLRTQRKPMSHGLSTTKVGTLLKQQIPIRTFHEWNEVQPGFLEADLVAHCGGHTEGGYLYTLTLTDVATGWTKCLLLLYKSPEAVLSAFHQARQLFPFPILGLDTDNGGEFINERLVAYCAQEQITFTRGRPELKNDQCFVEQKNGAIVRQMVGYDRLSGEVAYWQLREVYRALRLYVNCFQPSMKLQAKDHDGQTVRRVYDSAKTPLQRLLLSGIFPAPQQQELSEGAQTLDPLGLVNQLEQLRHALWRCAADSLLASSRFAALPIQSFSLDPSTMGPLSAHVTETASAPPSALHFLRQEHESCPDILDWPRTTRDPFEEEWELILSLVLAHPERSSGDLFQELQRLFPGRYAPSQLTTLQRGVRKIRARLLETVGQPWPHEVIQGNVLAPLEPEPDQHEREADPSKAQAGARALPHPLPVEGEVRHSPVSALPATEQRLELSSDEGSLTPQAHQESLSQTESHVSLQVRCPAMTVERAIESYIQDQVGGGRSPKTMEWHQTALSLFQQYLVTQRHLLLLNQITESEVRGWLTFLRTTPSATGILRVTSTVATYARSARAFCHWLVRQGYLERTPWASVSLPKERKKPICLIEPQEFDRLLLACRPPGDISSMVDRPTARNRAILWVLLDTGMRVSELCGLRLGDVDREQGTLRVEGRGKEHWIALSPHGRDQLLSYLDQYRPRGVFSEGGSVEEDHLFLSDRYQPLTPNGITLLFDRLKRRAGITQKRVNPSLLRDTFAVRYLLTGGDPEVLRERLDLQDLATVKRYQHFSDQ